MSLGAVGAGISLWAVSLAGAALANGATLLTPPSDIVRGNPGIGDIMQGESLNPFHGNYCSPGTAFGLTDRTGPLNFPAQIAAFTSQSDTWALDATTAYGLDSGGELNIRGVSSAGWVIFNVAGTPDALSGNMHFDGRGNNVYGNPTAADDVLFHFYRATAPTLGISSIGAVLAPDASVPVGTGFHSLAILAVPVPEPAPVILISAGWVALTLCKKRRRGLPLTAREGVGVWTSRSFAPRKPRFERTCFQQRN